MECQFDVDTMSRTSWKHQDYLLELYHPTRLGRFLSREWIPGPGPLFCQQRNQAWDHIHESRLASRFRTRMVCVTIYICLLRWTWSHWSSLYLRFRWTLCEPVFQYVRHHKLGPSWCRQVDLVRPASSQSGLMFNHLIISAQGELAASKQRATMRRSSMGQPFHPYSTTLEISPIRLK